LSIVEIESVKKKAVALMSGGLDSALAVHLVKQQGIEVTAVHFTSFFSTTDPSDENWPVGKLAQQLGVPVVLRPKGRDFLDLIRNPRYGHGKNINPCIDCRIYTFIKAKAFMEEIGASFMVTGEVVGQRPMSQRRHTIRLIEKQAECDGIVLRPLSARTLERTLPELDGTVDRDRLLNVAGRGRKVQLALAQQLGLTGYSPPAGGCLLTDRVFAGRLADLLRHTLEPSQPELDLLRFGRHMRLHEGLRIVVGRKQDENDRLDDLSNAGVLFYPLDFPGPSILAIGRPTPEEESIIGGVVRRYSKESYRQGQIAAREPSGRERIVAVHHIADDPWISSHMI